MRVLAHVHTFNDADIIDRTIAALRGQTRPVDGILVVDNASTDGTLERPSLAHATVLRQQKNLGTSGAVAVGFLFALDHDYDWIWVLDADGAPSPDALKRLLDLYSSWPAIQQDETGFLTCMPVDQLDGTPLHGGFFSPLGRVPVTPAAEDRHYPCQVTIWSGCLFRLDAVRRIGLPNTDYVLDWGEDEYCYRVMKAGYKGYMHQDSVLNHNIRGRRSLTAVPVKLGPATVTFYEFAPIRCYYTCRNSLYFAIYDTAQGRFGLLRGRIWRLWPSPGRPGFLRGVAWRAFLLMLNFLLRPRHHRAQILACARGIWHGFNGNIAARY